LLPRRVVAVGDSTAGALARNVSKDPKAELRFYSGSISGCSVNSSGQPIGQYKTGVDWRICRGWQQRWAASARRAAAEVALVVIGPWDVFDIKYPDRRVAFGSPEFDRSFTDRLQSGIDQLLTTGAKVALLEVPCFRPHSTGGPGTFEFPERRDDVRTAHISDLLRAVADRDPVNVTFVTGPTEWCHDEQVATNRWDRYDGVHYGPAGARLVYRSIKDQLLAIPVDPAQHSKKPSG
jgi:hypothetical protein